MADTTNNKVDMGAIAFDLAKESGLADDKEKFSKFEEAFVKKFYELLGLSDIPAEFLNFTKFLETWSSVLVKSVQNDIALMNMTKRLSMYRLSENIASTAQKVPEGVPPPASEPTDGAAPQAPTGADTPAK